tara:strand:- start:36614 stop:37495 length:882 start_codon:yes stop_codon:yes gene_type:complete
MAKNKRNRYLGLKKYNRILKFLKGDKKVSLSEFRKLQQQAKGVYPSFKDVTFSKITKRKVKNSDATLGKVNNTLKTSKIRIGITDLSKSELDLIPVPLRFFELKELEEFNSKYPEIPIVIQTNDNQFRINGSLGEYGGSDLANFVNDELRAEYDNDYEVAFNYEITNDYLLIIPEDLSTANKKSLIGKKITFGTPTKSKKREIVKRELTAKEKTEEEKAKKKKGKVILKKGKGKKLPEVTKKVADKTTPTSLADKTKAIDSLVEQFKLGLIDKEEFRTEKKEIKDMFEKGGKI